MSTHAKRLLLRTMLLFLVSALVLCVLALYMKVKVSQPQSGPAAPGFASLPVMHIAELKQHDGTNPALPIYIALDGAVYDVTAGKNFYEKGGTYQYIAGTDASAALHMYGADIIRSKYPVIARFVSGAGPIDSP